MVTDDHVRELVGILQDMLLSKVNSIVLLKLDWVQSCLPLTAPAP